MFKYDELHSKVCLDKEKPGYTNVENILGSSCRGYPTYKHIPFDEIEWGPNVRIAPELAPYFHLSCGPEQQDSFIGPHKEGYIRTCRTALRLIWMFDPNIINLYSLERYVGKIEYLLLKMRPHPFQDVKTVGSCFYATEPYADTWIGYRYSLSSDFPSFYAEDVLTGFCEPGFFHLGRSMKENHKSLAF